MTMKKLILPLILQVLIVTITYSQNCSKYEKGMKLKLSVKPFVAAIQFQPDFSKMKDKKKAKIIEEYNLRVLANQEKQSYGGDFVYEVASVDKDNEGERVLLKSEISGKTYFSVIACKNDTMLIYRNADIVWSIEKGDTLGYTIQGPQIIPNKLAVGDKLPIYEDVSFSLPIKNEITAKWPEFQGYHKSYSYSTGMGYDSKSGNFASGKWKTTTTKAIYKSIDVKGKQILKPKFNSLHYINAVVERTEDVQIDEKKYTAYVIESEHWTKFKIDVSYEMESANCEAYYNKAIEKMDKKISKNNVKAKIENEQGYSVTYLTEWFVPGIGIVKSLGYDMNG